MAEAAVDKCESQDSRQEATNDGLSSQVASHYNKLPEKGKASRYESRIFFQRNFNNWVKSVCLADALRRIREGQRDRKVVALDLCCGKGGDLLKWKKGNISHLVCADIAGVSVEQCQQRYRDLNNRGPNRGPPPFTAEFFTADCADQVLKKLYKDPEMTFDLASCQFSFHYSFETQERAERMMENACERLRPGGLFVGTMPNGCELVRRVKESEDLSFGNEVYSVTFKSKDQFSLFGCIYDFHLEGVVDCPEFLVYFPLFQKLAEKHNMKVVYCDTFSEFFNKHCHKEENKELLGKMKALEIYPPRENASMASSKDGDYDHIKRYLEEKTANDDDDRQRPKRYGTLSKAEWEATSLYLVFALQKETTSSVEAQLQTSEGSVADGTRQDSAVVGDSSPTTPPVIEMPR